MIIQPCPYGGPDHEFPDDWVFGGPNNSDPAADPRFENAHYQFIDAEYGFSFMSGQFRCDDAALEYFTTVAEMDPLVRYIAVKRYGETKYTLMPWIYYAETDTLHPYERKGSNE